MRERLGRGAASADRRSLAKQTPPGTCPGAFKPDQRGIYGTSVKSTPETACELPTRTLSRTPF